MPSHPQHVVSSELEIPDLTLDPINGGPFEIDPHVERSIAFLVGMYPTSPRTPKFLACTDMGYLYTFDGSLMAALGNATLDGALWDGGYSTAHYLKIIEAAIGASPASIDYKLTQILVILNDVYDSTNHALRTKEAP